MQIPKNVLYVSPTFTLSSPNHFKTVEKAVARAKAIANAQMPVVIKVYPANYGGVTVDVPQYVYLEQELGVSGLTLTNVGGGTITPINKIISGSIYNNFGNPNLSLSGNTTGITPVLVTPHVAGIYSIDFGVAIGLVFPSLLQIGKVQLKNSTDTLFHGIVFTGTEILFQFRDSGGVLTDIAGTNGFHFFIGI